MSSLTSSLSSGSGLDVQATVDQLIYSERAPERLMQQQQSKLNTQAATMRSIQSKFQNLENTVDSLKDFSGAISARTATSSQPAILSATADSSSITGIHTIQVQQLATCSSYYSDAVTDLAFKFGANSTFKVAIGDGVAKALTLDGKTLQQAATYINGLIPGARASVVKDATGKRLALAGENTGTSGAIKITEDNTHMNWQTQGPAQNAKLQVDGIPIESTSNVVEDVILGVTLTISGETGQSPVQLSVGPDVGRAKQAVSNFVDSYNAALKAINDQFKVDPQTKQAGILSGDSTLRDLQSALLAAVSHKVEGAEGSKTLRSLGIQMQNDGSLEVKSDILDGVLRDDFSGFQDFFQSTTDGFARSLGTQLARLNDSVDGPIAIDLKSMGNTTDAISDQIDDFEVRIETRRQVLLDQYTRIDMMLRQLPVLQSQITAQLGSLDSK
jgi:flagellar hook-associated protein 2